MNPSLEIAPQISAQAETCWRCADIGLPPLGIAPGEQHILLVTPGMRQRACLDCWGRLVGEVLRDQQGEGWKDAP